VKGADGVTAAWLKSERLVLDPLRVEHADDLAPVLNDSALHDFIGGVPMDVAQLRARFERQVRGRSPDGHKRWLNWTVRELAAGKAVGTVQATVTGHPPTASAELAWVIGRAHQGRGFAQEAVGLMVSWLRERGIRRLGAHIHPRHHASMAVARSISLAPTDVIVDGERRWELSV